MRKKKSNDDTSKMYILQKELDEMLQSDDAINKDLKDKSQQLTNLLLLKQKEDKGLNVMLLLFFVLLGFLGFTTVILDNKNDTLQSRVSLLEQFIDINLDSINNVLIIDYKDKQIARNDSLVHVLNKQIIEQKMELRRYELFCQTLKRDYGISFQYKKEKRNNGNIVTVLEIEAEKVDSALMLLPEFRDRLHRINKNSWRIDLK